MTSDTRIPRNQAIKIGFAILVAIAVTVTGLSVVASKSYAKGSGTMKFDYEVLIVGGGPAGLSAAMTLGRISRTALVCDDNRPRNAPSLHINNFPTRDGIHPEKWRQHARRDLKKYKTIKFFDGRVLSVEQAADGFRAKLSSGTTVTIKKVILAYGIKDKMPPIPGFLELWGRSIFHCPFCHGFEIRGSKIGIVLSDETAFHSVQMIQSLSPDLVVFTNGKVQLTDEQKQYLSRKRITLVEEKIVRLQQEGETLKSVEVENGKRIERQYLFYKPEMPYELKSDIGESLGARRNQSGLYEVNEMGATTVPGVFAAGDNMSMAQSVLLACASGVKAGMMTIAELLKEE